MLVELKKQVSRSVTAVAFQPPGRDTRGPAGAGGAREWNMLMMVFAGLGTVQSWAVKLLSHPPLGAEAE